MKHKLLKDVEAHYNLVNNRMSPEAINISKTPKLTLVIEAIESN